MNMKLRSWIGAVLLPGIAVGLTGCGEHDHQGHAHAGGGGGGHKHGSAHGGVATELGEHQYQLDLLHDPATGTLTAWIMDGHMEGFVKIATAEIAATASTATATNAVVLKAVANAATDEKAGDTSQFQGQSDALKGVGGFALVVPVLEIRGNRFTNVTVTYAPPAGGAR